MKGISILAALIAIALMAPGGASFAQGSAGAEATCELVPLELPLFGGTPIAQFATPTASPEAIPEADLAEIERVLEQYVACVNTGDPTLVWAMFTPRWFSSVFADPEEHYLPAFEQMLDTPGAVAANPLRLEEIHEIAQDGGTVEVTATFASGDAEWTDTLVLVQTDGQWLIDDIRLDTRPGT